MSHTICIHLPAFQRPTYIEVLAGHMTGVKVPCAWTTVSHKLVNQKQLAMESLLNCSGTNLSTMNESQVALLSLFCFVPFIAYAAALISQPCREGTYVWMLLDSFCGCYPNSYLGRSVCLRIVFYSVVGTHLSQCLSTFSFLTYTMQLCNYVVTDVQCNSHWPQHSDEDRIMATMSLHSIIVSATYAIATARGHLGRWVLHHYDSNKHSSPFKSKTVKILQLDMKGYVAPAESLKP